MWGLDHSGLSKVTESRNIHIIVAIDYMSKWIKVEVVPSIPVILFLKKIFFRHGFPVRFVSDRGPVFGSRELSEFTEK